MFYLSIIILMFWYTEKEVKHLSESKEVVIKAVPKTRLQTPIFSKQLMQELKTIDQMKGVISKSSN